MKLVLAEKPSVAQSLAKVQGANKRCDGYLEGKCSMVLLTNYGASMDSHLCNSFSFCLSVCKITANFSKLNVNTFNATDIVLWCFIFQVGIRLKQKTNN